jgi:phosphate transport system substrate-binding protein
LWIRLGEPDEIPSTAYEIGTDEIVVVAHPDNPIHSLTLADIRALFSGEIRNWDELGSKDMPVQVWAFGPSEDIRQIFDATVMLQQPISSEAHLALNTDSMATGVGSEPGATGFLPRSLVKPDIQIVNIDQLSSSIIVPVLAFTAPDADDATMTLVACMQNK